MRRKDEKAPENVANELVQTLTESIRERTKIERERVNAERDRERELQALHGDIQAVALGLGELVGRIDEINRRLVDIDNRMTARDRELRADMVKQGNIGLQISVLLEKALRGWTQAAQAADEQGVDIVKPPGYDL